MSPPNRGERGIDRGERGIDPDWKSAAASQLRTELTERADRRTREHWERYMKGAARFRGVPMAGIRAAMRSVWSSQDLGARSVEEIFDLTDGWFAAPMSEDKLAAVLLLAEQAAPRLARGHTDALARPLAVGDIADWNVCDWYSTKALHAFISADVADRAPAIAAWASADGLWQRRAGVVAFAKLAARADEQPDGFVATVLQACEDNLVSEERFAHTGPGWVLRELSRPRPDAVRRFVDEHRELSGEARRMATARLRSGPYRRR